MARQRSFKLQVFSANFFAGVGYSSAWWPAVWICHWGALVVCCKLCNECIHLWHHVATYLYLSFQFALIFIHIHICVLVYVCVNPVVNMTGILPLFVSRCWKSTLSASIYEGWCLCCRLLALQDVAKLSSVWWCVWLLPCYTVTTLAALMVPPSISTQNQLLALIGKHLKQLYHYISAYMQSSMVTEHIPANRKNVDMFVVHKDIVTEF